MELVIETAVSANHFLLFFYPLLYNEIRIIRRMLEKDVEVEDRRGNEKNATFDAFKTSRGSFDKFRLVSFHMKTKISLKVSVIEKEI